MLEMLSDRGYLHLVGKLMLFLVRAELCRKACLNQR